MKSIYAVIMMFAASTMCILSARGEEDPGNSYQLIHSKDTLYFGKQNGYVLSLRVKKYEMDGSDSIFHFPGNLFQIETGSGIENYSGKSSWIGTKLKVKADGEQILFNHDDEEILLKTRASKGDSWVAYHSALTGMKVYATVTGIVEEEILGIKDSVKIITLEIPGSSDAAMVESYAVAISKKHGVVRCPQLCLFPFSSPMALRSIFFDNRETIELVGSSSPKRGVGNLTWGNVFDFSPEDEIHRTKIVSQFQIPYEEGYYSALLNRKEILICLNRTRNEKEETVYRFHREFEETRKNYPAYGSDGYSFGCDTVTWAYGKNPVFDILPGEIAVEGESVRSWYQYYSDVSHKQSITREFIVADPENENRYINPVIDDINAFERYYHGLGMLSSAGYTGNGMDEDFVYYKKGNVTWGTPIIFSSVENIPEDPHKIIVEEKQIRVNGPSSSFPVLFEVFTMDGTLLTKGTVYSPEERVQMNNLTNTAVIVHLIPRSGKDSSVKIIP